MKKKNKINYNEVIQELLRRMGGNFTVKFALTDDFQQRVIVRNWVTGEEKLNIPIYDEVIDVLDINEINEKIIKTFVYM